MVTCDLFEVRLIVGDSESPNISWELLTDLPPGTQFILTCTRSFLDMRGSKCLWTGHNERVEVQPTTHGDYNGCMGRVDVDASDKKGLELFNEINASFSPGIKTAVSDEVTLTFTVGARQRLRTYGKGNNELSGQMVATVGGVNVVEVEKQLVLPMKKAFQPIIQEPRS